jgi:hypothetical protein
VPVPPWICGSLSKQFSGKLRNARAWLLARGQVVADVKKQGTTLMTDPAIYPRFRPTLRLILPCVFLLTTYLLLSLASRHNNCHEVAEGYDTCMSLPELFAALVNGPGLCVNCTLQFEYLPSEYFVGRLVGVFVFWFWAGWRLEGFRVATPERASVRTWLPFASYALWIFITAARTYATVSHDRIKWAFVAAVLHEKGILVLLQAGGRIWAERAQAAWLLVLVICLVKEMQAQTIQFAPSK